MGEHTSGSAAAHSPAGVMDSTHAAWQSALWKDGRPLPSTPSQGALWEQHALSHIRSLASDPHTQWQVQMWPTWRGKLDAGRLQKVGTGTRQGESMQVGGGVQLGRAEVGMQQGTHGQEEARRVKSANKCRQCGRLGESLSQLAAISLRQARCQATPPIISHAGRAAGA